MIVRWCVAGIPASERKVLGLGELVLGKCHPIYAQICIYAQMNHICTDMHIYTNESHILLGSSKTYYSHVRMKVLKVIIITYIHMHCRIAVKVRVEHTGKRGREEHHCRE